jgi:hypothetical protein
MPTLSNVDTLYEHDVKHGVSNTAEPIAFPFLSVYKQMSTYLTSENGTYHHGNFLESYR